MKQLSGLVDDNALDLLQRMLAFAPQRRCSADEALFHTYVSGLLLDSNYLRAPGGYLSCYIFSLHARLAMSRYIYPLYVRVS